MFIFRYSAAVAISLAMASAVCAAPSVSTPAADPAATPQASSALAATAKPISDEALSEFSGGQAIVAINEQQLTALNSGNEINAAGNVVNGAVSLSAGAFSGFSGLGNFVINTGNNNNVQGTLSVNIMLVPTP